MVSGALGARREEILRAVVSEYVRSAEPVGSRHLLEVAGISASSATIRAQMAQLERDGYLVQPHVSAGRVPSVKGYRYYVDELMEVDDISTRTATTLAEEFLGGARGALETVLEQTLSLLASVTEYTAVITTWSSTQETVKGVQLVTLASDHVMVVLIGSRGTLERVTFLVHGQDGDMLVADDQECAQASVTLGEMLRGYPLRGPFPRPPADASRLVAAALQVLNENETATEPELRFRDVSRTATALLQRETVNQLLETLEQRLLLVTVVRRLLDAGETVSIGEESGLAALAECSLVVAPCEIDGEVVGSIGVLGPTRMNYPRTTAVVSATQKVLAHAVR